MSFQFKFAVPPCPATVFALAIVFTPFAAAEEYNPRPFLETHCFDCHEGGEERLDLSGLAFDPAKEKNFSQWVKIFDRVAYGEMPPRDADPPSDEQRASFMRGLHDRLAAAEQVKLKEQPRTPLRRLTRAEYENSMRDLFDMPGIGLAEILPADGSAHGFDKNSDALDFSHVNMAKYLEAADHALDYAIAVQPQAPTPLKMRTSLAYPAGFVAHVLLHGDGVLLKNKQPDPDFPPAGAHGHLDQGAHERLGSFKSGASVGLFRPEDESFHPYFNEFVTLYPGRYRIRTSLWSFQWDKGKVLPSRGTEAARLSIVTLTGDGRGGGHPSELLTYLDAPSLQSQEHELVTWFNYRDTLGFNTASLARGGQTRGPLRAMGFTGPGIACDWLEIEGPLHENWPPASHRRLFGDLPLVRFSEETFPGQTPPRHKILLHPSFPGTNKPDPVEGIWTVQSNDPTKDVDRLLADFLPRAFRRPVSEQTRKQYLAQFQKRFEAGDCFELALRYAYRAALCSPDFLFHVEPEGKLDDAALACRLSYFLWNSLPDERLSQLAQEGKLREPVVLRGEAERLLADPRSQRFIEDFLGQWLKLRKIAANDPDPTLYPEFSVYLQNSMVAETHAYFRELLDKNLDAGHLVRSDFAMLNEKLAVHYGIEGVSGSQIRRVPLPPDCPRGGFLTQASILKITANGTTTSPVPRGAFVLDRLLGRPPEPPPENVAAIEPDVRGATTIREQLQKHRDYAACAACHAKMDPPGFALESFDVIGGFRDRYRTIGTGDPVPQGKIDPFIGIGFRLGPAVDSSGELPDGRKFSNISELQSLLAEDQTGLLTNLATQFAVYSTGRPIRFSDRAAIAAMVAKTDQQGSGVRTLIHELIQSPLFLTH